MAVDKIVFYTVERYSVVGAKESSAPASSDLAPLVVLSPTAVAVVVVQFYVFELRNIYRKKLKLFSSLKLIRLKFLKIVI